MPEIIFDGLTVWKSVYELRITLEKNFTNHYIKASVSSFAGMVDLRQANKVPSFTRGRTGRQPGIGVDNNPKYS